MGRTHTLSPLPIQRYKDFHKMQIVCLALQRLQKLLLEARAAAEGDDGVFADHR